MWRSHTKWNTILLYSLVSLDMMLLYSTACNIIIFHCLYVMSYSNAINTFCHTSSGTIQFKHHYMRCHRMNCNRSSTFAPCHWDLWHNRVAVTSRYPHPFPSDTKILADPTGTFSKSNATTVFNLSHLTNCTHFQAINLRRWIGTFHTSRKVLTLQAVLVSKR